MADRPFRGGGYGGIAPIGEGINQGVNSFVQNYLAMKRQQTMDKYSDIAGRREAIIEGQLKGQTAPMGQPPIDAGGGGAAVLATPTASAPPTLPIPLAPGVEMSRDPGGANYLARESSLEAPLPQDEGPSSPHFQPRAIPASYQAPPAPTPMQMAQAGPVGAQALASDTPVEEMSLDELRELSLQHSIRAREEALANENDLEMLGPAYHYRAQMNLAKPYLDQWAKALTEVKANPQNPDKWRGVQVLTGEEDPQKALAMATKEYSQLRGQYEEYGKNYSPLNEQLTKRGITPEMYGDEAKFLQFKNQRKFKPHTPTGRGAGVLRTPKTTRR